MDARQELELVVKLNEAVNAIQELKEEKEKLLAFTEALVHGECQLNQEQKLGKILEFKNREPK